MNMMTPMSSRYFFFCWIGVHRDLHSFPTRRSSDLSVRAAVEPGVAEDGELQLVTRVDRPVETEQELQIDVAGLELLLRSEEHTSELQSHSDLVCRLLLEKKKAPQP